jgi:adenylate kinase
LSQNINHELFQTVLLFGPPGSGKGTQGRALGSIPGFYHFACGEVFRQLNPNSKLGRVFLEYSSKGELVPDELTIQLWLDHIQAQTKTSAYKPETDLLVLDGIPRNVEQAKLIDEHLRVLKVINLHCPDEEQMIQRIRRRALKENRPDDAKESVIRNRWEVYREETEPVLAVYPEELKTKVNALSSPAEVLRDVLNELIPVQDAHFRRLQAQAHGAAI